MHAWGAGEGGGCGAEVLQNRTRGRPLGSATSAAGCPAGRAACVLRSHARPPSLPPSRSPPFPPSICSCVSSLTPPPFRLGPLSLAQRERWPGGRLLRGSGRSLTEKKSVPEPVFPKKPAGTPCAQPWLVAVGGWWRLVVVGGGWWWLVVGGGWLAVGGGWRRLVVGDWWLVAVGSGWQLAVGRGWRLAAVGGWRLVAVGGWRLAVGGPLRRSLRAVLSKKKMSSRKDRPGVGGGGGGLGPKNYCTKNGPIRCSLL